TNIGFKNLYPALSVLDLQKKLKNDYGGIITTTLQKFQEPNKATEETTDQTEQEESENKKVEKYIQDGILTKITRIWDKEKQNWIETEKEEIELEKLSDKDNLYVLVDEAHRSHYGFLAALMRTVIPKAKFIAFTGTPVSKEDKSTLAEFYGEDYIDVYTIKQSVADGATKDLLYDEGIARLDIKKEELDKKFEEEYSDLPEEKKEKLKKEALKRYQFSKERIKAISKHIIDHYKRKIYPDGHKAMVVCQGRYAAAKYKMIFEELKEEGYHNFKSKVIISLGNPKNDSVAKKVYERREYNKQHPNNPLPEYITPEEEIKESIEDFKLPFGDESVTEKSGAKKYNNIAFLIVSDMLLTGYDAPIASCLYLDKPLKEHNLLQAIARVNRAYNRHGNKKHAGYIVDYYGITEYLIQALEIFSGDVKKEDILKNLDEEIPRLKTNHAKLTEFFKPIKTDRNYQREQFIDDAIRYLEPINLRDEFKDLLKQFNKSLDIVLPNEEAMRYEKDFKLFNEIKLRLKNIYPEDEDLKISADESKKLQRMIDEHVKATGVDNLLEEPVSIIDKENFKKDIMNASPETKELKIKNNLKHTIKVGLDRNPDFYKPLAERLEELIKKREENRISQLQIFDAFDEMQNQIINEQKEGQRKGFYTEKEVAVYNTMKAIFGENAEQTTKEIFQQINGELSIVDWKNKGGVKKDMENKIMKKLKEKLNRNEARKKAGEIVQLIIKNA
ncbi:MAG: type I restriction enzyme subunit R domain-containing protein, partial [bacterium]